MKEPIEPSEIRKGDLIRWESKHSEHAHEWRAQTDRAWWADEGQHYLLNRPRPAVEFPSEPTLGWLRLIGAVGDGPPSTWRFEHSGMDDSRRARNEWGYVVADVDDKIASFTPATAVPTAALDELRDACNRDCDEYGCECAIAAHHFLAAVDEAQS
ncbi:hypothetical protein [Aeromicrobium sp.]|uniref:hypothetical protein n=1 Tax=Aeromicrobium sp. TaxID=1871063 RepID=UPI002FC79C02